MNSTEKFLLDIFCQANGWSDERASRRHYLGVSGRDKRENDALHRTTTDKELIKFSENNSFDCWYLEFTPMSHILAAKELKCLSRSPHICLHCESTTMEMENSNVVLVESAFRRVSQFLSDTLRNFLHTSKSTTNHFNRKRWRNSLKSVFSPPLHTLILDSLCAALLSYKQPCRYGWKHWVTKQSP